MIGIRLANNTFFPVLDENGHARTAERPPRKRLVLTTVKDDQETVQIDLYRGDAKEISSDAYLASLTVENIRTARAGEPDIELVMGTDETGQLQARAFDRAGGSENSLSVSLQELPPEQTYDTPDFSIDDDFATPESLGEYSFDEEAGGFEESAEDLDEEDRPAAARRESIPTYEEPKRKAPVLAIVLLAAGVIAIAVLAYFLLRPRPAEQTPPLAGQGTPQTQQQPSAQPEPPAASGKTTPSEPSATASTPPAAQKPPAAAPAPAAPQAATEPKDGVWYRIAFGDTLWDLAYSFYNNPRQFDRIAKKNNIANPNKIYGGNRIFIPLDQSTQNGTGK
ncbi:Hsp70 family protein [Salinispira pacifica]